MTGKTECARESRESRPALGEDVEGMDKIKILVVDDESRMRKLVKDFLTKKGYEVLEAGDGEEALDLFFKDKEIALIILDVMMPKWTAGRSAGRFASIPKCPSSC